MKQEELLNLIKKGKTLKKCKVLSAIEPNHQRKIISFVWPHLGKNYDQWAVVKVYNDHTRIVKICPTRRSAGYYYGRG